MTVPRSIIPFIFSLLLLSEPTIAVTAELLQRGQVAFQKGAYEPAIQHWETALKSDELSISQQLDTLINLAIAYQTIGHYSSSHKTLQQALSLTEIHNNLTKKALVYSYLGDVLLAIQQLEPAKKYLEEGITIARTLDKPLLLAHLYNNLGNVFSVEQDYSNALEILTKSAKLAERHGDTILPIQVGINKVKIYLKQKDDKNAFAELESLLSQVRQRPDNLSKGFQLLSLAKLALAVQNASQFPIFKTAYDLLSQASHLAEQFKDNRLTAYAKGYLGQVYEQAERYQEALQLTQEAIFHSQAWPDLLYRWEWQRGRLLQAQQDIQGAKTAYQQALNQLQPIRANLTLGQRDAQEVFYERIRPVYFSLADVLLQQALVTTSPTEKANLLNQARNTVEQLKAAELQNYFQDECISETRITPLDSLDKQTAVFYPILLTSRLELLLSLPDGIHQFVVPVSSDTLTQTVLEFQRNLQERTNFRFIEPAQQLYDWLIAPIRAQLSSFDINTLVVVPDGPLRMIPMAALYDGKHFLIEQLALATTPGLDLTEPHPLPKQPISVLLSGLSESVQEFAPLPNVPQEIHQIQILFNHNDILLDKTFLLDNIQTKLQINPYSIVHIASHGQFNRDPKKTFLLTYDDKLTMDRLENLLAFSQFRENPVELLTLSACQTAVGDERAALGLAGVAIKAGARSALASLWFVNDKATSVLITEFYKQLKKPSLSKAQALQVAQKQLIEMRFFRHPAFWAPFLLIGNWL